MTGGTSEATGGHRMNMPGEQVDQFSALELKNNKFKKVVWIASFLLVCVLAILGLEMAGVIRSSPF
jgi:hypothetical protein